MGYFITMDAGTTSIKVCLFNEQFKILGYSSEEYQLETPAKDIVELDPENYWNAARSGISKVMSDSGTEPSQVKVITITTQGETLIPVNEEGKALHKAVVWIDARASEESAIISGLISNDDFYRNTGMPEITSAHPLSKVLWFKRNRNKIFKNTYKFLLLEDYLISRMTGEFVTEHSLISSTGYFDINKRTLWSRALNLLDLNEALFPEILPCGKVVGNLTEYAAGELGLDIKTVVSTGAMDQIASAVGAGNIKPGIITETTGTALVIAATSEKPDYDNYSKITYYTHYDNNFIILPYCTTAGIVLKWFKDEFCGEVINKALEDGVSVYKILDMEAEKVNPGSDGLVLLPHLAGKLTPDINPAARGVFFGFGLDTHRGHFVRAILESIAYMLRENIELVESLNIDVKEIRSLGGGSKSKLWNSIKTDVCARDFIVMEQEESTSLGAAMLGALSTGLYGGMEEIVREAVKVKKVSSPDPLNKDIYMKAYEQYLNIYNNVKKLYSLSDKSTR